MGTYKNFKYAKVYATTAYNASSSRYFLLAEREATYTGNWQDTSTFKLTAYTASLPRYMVFRLEFSGTKTTCGTPKVHELYAGSLDDNGRKVVEVRYTTSVVENTSITIHTYIYIDRNYLQAQWTSFQLEPLSIGIGDRSNTIDNGLTCWSYKTAETYLTSLTGTSVAHSMDTIEAKVTTATSATKATQDSDGNAINVTYFKSSGSVTLSSGTATKIGTQNGSDVKLTLPTIPADANNGALKIGLNGGTATSKFTANQSGDSTLTFATGSTAGTIKVDSTEIAVAGFGDKLNRNNTTAVLTEPSQSNSGVYLILGQYSYTGYSGSGKIHGYSNVSATVTLESRHSGCGTCVISSQVNSQVTPSESTPSIPESAYTGHIYVYGNKLDASRNSQPIKMYRKYSVNSETSVPTWTITLVVNCGDYNYFKIANILHRNGVVFKTGTMPTYASDASYYVTTANLSTLGTEIASAQYLDHSVTQTEDTTSTSTAFEILFSNTADSTTRTETSRKSSKLTFQPSTGTLTATKFSGPLTGNVTGNCTGSSGSCTGNAATASKINTSAKIGDTNKPVYVAANGTVTPISYTIETSVPSTAVFTDEKLKRTPLTTSQNGDFPILCAGARETSVTTETANATGSLLTFNPSTQTLTTSVFSGNLNGNATTATTATTATALSSSAGSSQLPVYINSDGKPYAIGSSMALPYDSAEGWISCGVSDIQKAYLDVTTTKAGIYTYTGTSSPANKQWLCYSDTDGNGHFVGNASTATRLVRGRAYFGNISTGYALLATINTSGISSTADLHGIFKIQHINVNSVDYIGEQKLIVNFRYHNGTRYYKTSLVSLYNNSPLLSIKIFRTDYNDIRIYGYISDGSEQWQSIICTPESFTELSGEDATYRLTLHESTATNSTPAGTQITVDSGGNIAYSNSVTRIETGTLGSESNVIYFI